MSAGAISFRVVTWDDLTLPDSCSEGVHIWATPLHVNGSLDSTNFLSEKEVARADRQIFPANRQRFIRSHVFLRRVLAHYTQTSPADIKFYYGAHGKPGLANGIGSPSHHFNLSHCDQLALVAVTSKTTVGADVETVRLLPDYKDVARRFFGEHEYATLMALPEIERSRAFFRCWTRKEAVTKAIGLGLSMPLDCFEVTLAPESPPQVVSFECGDLTPPGAWSLIHIEPLADVVGAVALPVETVIAQGFLVC